MLPGRVRHRRCAGDASVDPKDFFTGSTEIGRRIMESASRDINESLELGGKSPNIAFADADWERAPRLRR